MHKKLFAIFFLALPLMLYAEDALEEQRIITIIDGEHDYDLNPHTAAFTSEAQILSGLYEGLFSYDPVTLDPLPALCKSYKISRDKKRWTFTLIDEAKFSDGSPITSQTLVNSWLTLLSTPNAPFASLLDCIKGANEYRMGLCNKEDVRIEARDEKTLVVHLTQSTEHLAHILCHHAFSAVSSSGNPKENVFSGAFILKERTPNSLYLEKNTEYHDKDSVMIPGIKVIQSDDKEENAYLFNTGNADWITGGAEASQILNDNALHISAEFGTTFLFFKIGNKPWDNKEFRTALLEAIPYDELRKNYSIPAHSLVYPLAGYPDVNGINDYDIDDAKELMEEARKNANISDEEIVIVIACTEDEYMREWAELLKKAWEKLNVTVYIQTTPSYRYNSSIPNWNADVFSYSWIGDFADPLAFLELFRSGSTLNVANYSNKEFDSLLTEASETNSSSEHLKILSKAEQLLLDDSMIIPISHPITMHIIDTTSLGGWQTNALDLHPLKYLYLKKQIKRLPNVVLVN